MFIKYWLHGVVLVMVAAAMTAESVAQQKDEGGKPGPEHKRLEKLVGTYNAKVRVYLEPGKPPSESTGTMVRTLMFGGRYLREDFKGDVGGQQFQGMGIVGYDYILRKYMSVWLDSESTDMMISQGTYNDATKTFTYESDQGDLKARDVLRIVSDNEQFFEMFRTPVEKGAKEFKVLDIRYTRKK
jgi:hypothetical protein